MLFKPLINIRIVILNISMTYINQLWFRLASVISSPTCNRALPPSPCKLSDNVCLGWALHLYFLLQWLAPVWLLTRWTNQGSSLAFSEVELAKQSLLSLLGPRCHIPIHEMAQMTDKIWRILEVNSDVLVLSVPSVARSQALLHQPSEQSQYHSNKSSIFAKVNLSRISVLTNERVRMYSCALALGASYPQISESFCMYWFEN